MGVGHTLKKIREKNGLTQEQFADKIGVKRTTYISYENSKTSPGFELIEKIAQIFDIPLLAFSEEDKVKKDTFLEFRAPEPVYNPAINSTDSKKLSGEEDMIVNFYRRLNEEDKAAFFEKIKNAYLDIICGVDNE